MKLEGKRIAITGSSRGLGRAFAIACAEEGAQVIINGTNEAALTEVAGTIKNAGGTVAVLSGSVAEESVCQSLVAKCVDTYGGIDTIIHNAGVVRDRTIMKMTAEEFDEVIAVHLRGAFLCTKHAALAMKETGGHIIHITSGSGLAGGFGQANYAAAKEGMMGLLRTAVLELTKFGIRCNAMWPVADTDMTQVVFERAKGWSPNKKAKPRRHRSKWVSASRKKWRKASYGWPATMRLISTANACPSMGIGLPCGGTRAKIMCAFRTAP